MSLNKKDILKFKWDKFVGRRQPPLRGILVYEGTIKWLKKRFNCDFSNLFLFFSNKKGEDITTDIFINVELKNKLLKLIKNEIQNNIHSLQEDLNEFKKDTNSLLKFSKTLLNVEKNKAKDNFDEFCRLWENFAPSLIFIHFLEEASTLEIINNKKDKEKTKMDLMRLITSDMESVLFNIKKRKSKVTISFPKKDHKTILLLKKLIKFRDWRKKVYDECWYNYSTEFFELLGQITGLKKHINWVSPYLIKDNLKQKKIFIFKKDILIFYDNYKIRTTYKKSIITLKEQLISSLFKKEIKGNSAYKGYIKGKVRIVEPHTKVKIFNKGDILIAKMTTPDLIPYIKKASAIVTDEGGITCHAAIVSREMKKPCVIGTKIATKVFKDNDLVEVDANKGTVKKLK
jgi:phosphohistidine swiveling domain-containing protein